MKNGKLLYITLIFFSRLLAVINTFEDSYSIIHNINTPFESIAMHEINVEDLLKQDKDNIGTGIPMRYAHSFDVDLGINNVGTWEILDDGGKIWRLGLKSPGAFGMKVLFDAYWLPQGSEIYIFSKFDNMSIGPYSYKQNNEDGSFGIPLVKSDHIVIEYYQPADVLGKPKINISTIFHAYIDVHNFYNNDDTRDCGDNIACSSANAYEDQANSSIYLEMGQYICSAALINNTSQDLTPYVLTAYHCVEGEANVGQHNYFTFYFNHESSSCSGSSGYYGHSETGSYLRAVKNENSSDVALLEMDDNPASGWDPYFAGWSRSTSYPQISASIHHPNGGAKKINFDNGDTSYGCSWYGSSTHWCLDWDDGGTAGGSSGSPIFNTDKRIVGQLSGCFIIGGNDCSDGCGGDDNAYGKFSTSWNGSSSSSRLKDWLDPGNTGLNTLDGTYDGASIVYGCTDSNACNYDPNATNNDDSCAYPQETCDCNGNPTGNYCNCSGNVEDCAGECGGSAEVDVCGICGGNGSSCAGSVSLSFSSIDGNAGTVEILMENDTAIAGFQFVIDDTPDVLDLIDISGGNSEYYDFTVSSSEGGIIIGFSLVGTNIPVGLGVLLIATFEGDEENIVELCLSDPIFSDTNGNSIPVTHGGCVNIDYSNSQLGDLNDDGIVNILDVVVLVNIVLGSDNLNSSGDLNDDGLVNILDVVILVNMILR